MTAATQGTAGGTVTFTATGVSYTPAANFTGADTFTYTISDGNGGTATAIVTVTVTSVNDNPVATDDAATVPEDSAATAIDVLANDIARRRQRRDADGDGGHAGQRERHRDVHGDRRDATRRPANFIGTDTFTYTIGDGNGGTATATVTVTVTSVNDNPVADDDTATVAEDSAATAIDVLANDSARARHRRDADGDGGHAGRDGTVTLVSGVVRYTPTAELLRAGQLHLHDQRRQRRDRDGDGQRDGDAGQRQPDREPDDWRRCRRTARRRRSTCWPTTRMAPTPARR